MSWVRRVILTLVCLAGLFVGSLAGAAAVLASGTSTSAGDQQYVDPLTGSTTTSHPSGSSGSTGSGSTGSTGSSGSSSSSEGSSSSTSHSTLSQTPPTAASSTSSSSAASGSGTSAGGHGGTLPFTGMNVWACVAIGVGLLGMGLVLRRRARLN
jgi:hypothetical protein